MLKKEGFDKLSKYWVEAANKDFEFWQRDPMAIHLYSRNVAYQKLDYIHANPTTQHWRLVDDPCDYKYSSAKLYEQEIKEFSFLKDLREEF